MLSKHRAALLSAATVLAGAGGLYASGVYSTEAATISVETLKDGIIDRRASFVGPVLPRENATVLPRLPSRVVKLYVHEGDVVGKGGPLALLDASELGIEVERKRVALERARLRVTRPLSGADGPAIPSANSDEAIRLLDIRAAELDLRRARAVFAEATLTAPIGGTVVQISAREGDMLSPARGAYGEGIIISAAEEFTIRGEVDEFDAQRVKRGASAEVRFLVGRGQVVAARVLNQPMLRRFRTDAKQAAMFEIAVRIEGTLPAGIVVGNSASVSIEASDRRPVLVAPVSAVVPIDGEQCLLVRQGSRFVVTRVTLGDDDGKNVAILSGATRGDRVAVGAPDELLKLSEIGR